LFPDLGENNYINMMPVDGVARICVAAAIQSPEYLTVLNASKRSLTFNSYLSSLVTYGYDVRKVTYDAWRNSLQAYVRTTTEAKRQEHALLPLYHLAVSDLPTDSRSPALDNKNAQAVLKGVGKGDVKPAFAVTEELVGKYLKYLVAVGFMPAPTVSGAKPLPDLEVSDERMAALRTIGGRGAVA
jgi:L-2-aminoadipate reductase